MYGPQALEVADFSAEGKAECCLLVSLCVCWDGHVTGSRALHKCHHKIIYDGAFHKM